MSKNHPFITRFFCLDQGVHTAKPVVMWAHAAFHKIFFSPYININFLLTVYDITY